MKRDAEKIAELDRGFSGVEECVSRFMSRSSGSAPETALSLMERLRNDVLPWTSEAADAVERLLSLYSDPQVEAEREMVFDLRIRCMDALETVETEFLRADAYVMEHDVVPVVFGGAAGVPDVVSLPWVFSSRIGSVHPLTWNSHLGEAQWAVKRLRGEQDRSEPCGALMDVFFEVGDLPVVDGASEQDLRLQALSSRLWTVEALCWWGVRVWNWRQRTCAGQVEPPVVSVWGLQLSVLELVETVRALYRVECSGEPLQEVLAAFFFSGSEVSGQVSGSAHRQLMLGFSFAVVDEQRRRLLEVDAGRYRELIEDEYPEQWAWEMSCVERDWALVPLSLDVGVEV